MTTKLTGYNRANIYDYIKNNIGKVPDDDLDKMYDFFVEISNCESKDVINRAIKVEFIKNNLDYTTDGQLKNAEKKFKECLKKKIETCEEMKIKIKIVLEIVNKLLVALDKETIDDLCDFKDIPREDLLSDQCIEVINDNKDYIFKNKFSKYECKIYLKNISNPHISILRGMLKQTGYVLSSKLKSRPLKDGRKRKYTAYFIEEKAN